MIKPLCASSLIELLYIVRCSCYGDIHSPEINLFGHWYHKRLLPCVLPRVADLYLNSRITYNLKVQGNQLNGFVKICILVCRWFNPRIARDFLRQNLEEPSGRFPFLCENELMCQNPILFTNSQKSNHGYHFQPRDDPVMDARWLSENSCILYELYVSFYKLDIFFLHNYILIKDNWYSESGNFRNITLYFISK